MKNRFEHIAFFTLLAVLTASLFIFRGDKQIVYLILGAIIGAFTNGSINKKEGAKE